MTSKTCVMILRVTFLVAVGLGMIGCARVNVAQRDFLFPGYAEMAPKAIAQLSQGTGYAVAYKLFHATDGTHLYGLLITRPGNRITVLYFGSDNFQTGTGGLGVAQMVESFGVNAFLVDYRGYGMSEGKPTYKSLESDALAAYDFTRSLPATKDTLIVVHGLSLGSMLAAYVADHRSVNGLVLESTATDVKDWANNQVPWYSSPFLHIDISQSLRSVSNINALKHYRGPLLLVVGSQDNTTPPAFSKKLYKISATPTALKMLYIAKGKHHGTAMNDTGSEREYRKFLSEVVRNGR